MKRYKTENDINYLNLLVKLFMEYIDTNDIPKKDNKIKFLDLDKTTRIDLMLYPWMVSQLHYNLKLFEQTCELYKNTYPNAYEKINLKITKRKNFLNSNQKIELLMEYLNNPDAPIPHVKRKISFCEISSKTENNTDVGIWIQEQLEHNEEKFIKLYESKKNKYPIAYQKLNHKILKRTTDIDEYRLEIMLIAIEQDKLNQQTRFIDIDPSSGDNNLINSWFGEYLKKNTSMEKIQFICKKYQNDYKIGTKKILQRLVSFISNKDNQPLSDNNRIEILLKYLNSPNNELELKLKFNELDLNNNDNTLIVPFILKQLTNNYEEFIHICESYQNLYPIAYRKILLRSKSFLERSNKLNNLLSFEEKLVVVLKYFEDENNKLTATTTFSDITNTLDTCNIRIWLNSNLSNNLNLLIETSDKYKDKYVFGYKRLTTLINKSKIRLSKQRKDLISILKQLKNNLPKEEINIKNKEK